MEEQGWRNWDRQELERQYSPSHWTHRMDKDIVIDAHILQITEGTKRARELTHPTLNVQYGERESEKMDLYLPDKTSFPLLVYIHGGYWQLLSKEEAGFMAPPLVSNGIAVMTMDYDIAPKGDMDLIVSQVRRSIAAAVIAYPQVTAVYVSGHSCGAHLAAMVLSTDWSQYGVTPNIKGALLVSGVYDIIPLLYTYVNDALKMSQEAAIRNSPMQLTTLVKKHSADCHVIVVIAEHDSPEYCRQSQDYYKRLKDLGLSVSFQQVEDTDHFDLMERLSQEEYVLTQLLLEMILKK